jgi:hypothetical protein
MYNKYFRIQHHKGNPAEIGRADAEEVMMYANFKSRRALFKNGHFKNVHFAKPGVEI